MQGTVIHVASDGQYGFIRPDSGNPAQVFVHVNALEDPAGGLVVNDRLEFETAPQADRKWPAAVNVKHVHTIAETPETTSRNCFVVMPIGKTEEEKEHFLGWYQVVIEPAIANAGLVPILSAANEQPNAINDEIRVHLALDPMVVIDLGGMTGDTEPNPNVMYELGIRHAFNLPHVIMAWDNQRLPFDIANQRVLMTSRKMKDIATTKASLTAFIREALAGNYYRPMDAVGRIATLSLAETQLGERSILRALVQEVRELRAPPSFRKSYSASRKTMKSFLGSSNRSLVHSAFVQAGGTEAQWGEFLKQQVQQEDAQGLIKGSEVATRVAREVYGLDIAPHLSHGRNTTVHNALQAAGATPPEISGAILPTETPTHDNRESTT